MTLSEPLYIWNAIQSGASPFIDAFIGPCPPPAFFMTPWTMTFPPAIEDEDLAENDGNSTNDSLLFSGEALVGVTPSALMQATLEIGNSTIRVSAPGRPKIEAQITELTCTIISLPISYSLELPTPGIAIPHTTLFALAVTAPAPLRILVYASSESLAWHWLFTLRRAAIDTPDTAAPLPPRPVAEGSLLLRATHDTSVVGANGAAALPSAAKTDRLRAKSPGNERVLWPSVWVRVLPPLLEVYDDEHVARQGGVPSSVVSLPHCRLHLDAGLPPCDVENGLAVALARPPAPSTPTAPPALAPTPVTVGWDPRRPAAPAEGDLAALAAHTTTPAVAEAWANSKAEGVLGDKLLLDVASAAKFTAGLGGRGVGKGSVALDVAGPLYVSFPLGLAARTAWTDVLASYTFDVRLMTPGGSAPAPTPFPPGLAPPLDTATFAATAAVARALPCRLPLTSAGHTPGLHSPAVGAVPHTPGRARGPEPERTECPAPAAWRLLDSGRHALTAYTTEATSPASAQTPLENVFESVRASKSVQENLVYTDSTGHETLVAPLFTPGALVLLECHNHETTHPPAAPHLFVSQTAAAAVLTPATRTLLLPETPPAPASPAPTRRRSTFAAVADELAATADGLCTDASSEVTPLASPRRVDSVQGTDAVALTTAAVVPLALPFDDPAVVATSLYAGTLPFTASLPPHPVLGAAVAAAAAAAAKTAVLAANIFAASDPADIFDPYTLDNTLDALSPAPSSRLDGPVARVASDIVHTVKAQFAQMGCPYPNVSSILSPTEALSRRASFAAGQAVIHAAASEHPQAVAAAAAATVAAAAAAMTPVMAAASDEAAGVVTPSVLYAVDTVTSPLMATLTIIVTPPPAAAPAPPAAPTHVTLTGGCDALHEVAAALRRGGAVAASEWLANICNDIPAPHGPSVAELPEQVSGQVLIRSTDKYAWQRRWALLGDGVLTMHSSKATAGATHTIVLDQYLLTPQPQKEKTFTFLLEHATTKGKGYLVSCPTEAAYTTWVSAIARTSMVLPPKPPACAPANCPFFGFCRVNATPGQSQASNVTSLFVYIDNGWLLCRRKPLTLTNDFVHAIHLEDAALAVTPTTLAPYTLTVARGGSPTLQITASGPAAAAHLFAAIVTATSPAAADAPPTAGPVTPALVRARAAQTDTSQVAAVVARALAQADARLALPSAANEPETGTVAAVASSFISEASSSGRAWCLTGVSVLPAGDGGAAVVFKALESDVIGVLEGGQPGRTPTDREDQFVPPIEAFRLIRGVHSVTRISENTITIEWLRRGATSKDFAWLQFGTAGACDRVYARLSSAMRAGTTVAGDNDGDMILIAGGAVAAVGPLLGATIDRPDGTDSGPAVLLAGPAFNTTFTPRAELCGDLTIVECDEDDGPLLTGRTVMTSDVLIPDSTEDYTNTSDEDEDDDERQMMSHRRMVCEEGDEEGDGMHHVRNTSSSSSSTYDSSDYDSDSDSGLGLTDTSTDLTPPSSPRAPTRISFAPPPPAATATPVVVPPVSLPTSARSFTQSDSSDDDDEPFESTCGRYNRVGKRYSVAAAGAIRASQRIPPRGFSAPAPTVAVSLMHGAYTLQDTEIAAAPALGAIRLRVSITPDRSLDAAVASLTATLGIPATSPTLQAVCHNRLCPVGEAGMGEAVAVQATVSIAFADVQVTSHDSSTMSASSASSGRSSSFSFKRFSVIIAEAGEAEERSIVIKPRAVLPGLVGRLGALPVRSICPHSTLNDEEFVTATRLARPLIISFPEGKHPLAFSRCATLLRTTAASFVALPARVSFAPLAAAHAAATAAILGDNLSAGEGYQLLTDAGRARADAHPIGHERTYSIAAHDRRPSHVPLPRPASGRSGDGGSGGDSLSRIADVIPRLANVPTLGSDAPLALLAAIGGSSSRRRGDTPPRNASAPQVESGAGAGAGGYTGENLSTCQLMESAHEFFSTNTLPPVRPSSLSDPFAGVDTTTGFTTPTPTPGPAPAPAPPVPARVSLLARAFRLGGQSEGGQSQVLSTYSERSVSPVSTNPSHRPSADSGDSPRLPPSPSPASSFTACDVARVFTSPPLDTAGSSATDDGVDGDLPPYPSPLPGAAAAILASVVTQTLGTPATAAAAGQRMHAHSNSNGNLPNTPTAVPPDLVACDNDPFRSPEASGQRSPRRRSVLGCARGDDEEYFTDFFTSPNAAGILGAASPPMLGLASPPEGFAGAVRLRSMSCSATETVEPRAPSGLSRRPPPPPPEVVKLPPPDDDSVSSHAPDEPPAPPPLVRGWQPVHVQLRCAPRYGVAPQLTVGTAHHGAAFTLMLDSTLTLCADGVCGVDYDQLCDVVLRLPQDLMAAVHSTAMLFAESAIAGLPQGGWLLKLSGRRWVRRYAAVTPDGHLTYGADPTDAHARVHKLWRAMIIPPAEVGTLARPPPGDAKHVFGIVVRQNAADRGKTIYFASNSQSQVDSWLALVKHAVGVGLDGCGFMWAGGNHRLDENQIEHLLKKIK